MKDVFTKKEGKLYAELKELSFQMMLNEASKLQIENSATFDAKYLKEHPYQLYSETEMVERHQKELTRADKEGFALALTFEELLLSNGYKFNAFVNGPNAVQIWAENFLNKYGLSYPLSWEVSYEDQDGLHFRYFKSGRIEQEHKAFLAKVEKLKVSDFEKERIKSVANYCRASRRLLTKYINGEVLNDEEEKGHTR